MVTIPLRLRSQVHGARCHWSVIAKRRRDERQVAALFMARHRPPSLPCRVTLIRIAPKRLDDDNLRQAFKAIRDEVTRWLGLTNDNDPRLLWRYQQGSLGRGCHQVRIEAITVTQAEVDEGRAAEKWQPSVASPCEVGQ